MHSNFSSFSAAMPLLRDNAARAQQTITLFWAYVVVSACSIASNLWFVEQLKAGRSSAELNATPLGLVHNLLIIAELGMLLTSFILFMRWLRRAYWNLRALGRPMEHGDGWAVGAWFVPIVNLFRPYSIVREVWRETQFVAFEHVSPHGLLRAWWGLFLLHSGISYITSLMAGNATTVVQLESAMWGNIITAVFMMATALLTVQVVRRIAGYESQMDLRLQVSLLGAPAPQPAAELLEDQSEYEY
jgi:hypothetical protein